jgi:hypothetical protein
LNIREILILVVGLPGIRQVFGLNCGMLLFANGEDAQERLSGLPDYNDPESYNYYSSGY